MPTYNFEELARDQGYVTSSSAEQGAAHCTYMLKGVNDTTPPTVQQLATFDTYLCGGVDNIDPRVTNRTDGPFVGKIRRRLPKLHPFKPELSVAGVNQIVGVGGQMTGTSTDILGVSAVTNQFTHYTAYEFVTEFVRRPYFLLSDDDIELKSITYYDLDGADHNLYVAEEWRRFTKTKLTPMPDTVNATTGGQMRFRTTGAPLNGTQYAGNAMMFLHNQTLEMDWFLVPYRYFYTFSGKKPYLTRFVNTVNQNAMLNFEAGQLLFLGATPEPYLPQSTNMARLLSTGLAQSQSLLCNVKLRWLVTTRESSDVPAAGTAGLANLNNVPAGHNLEPSFVDRRFYYVSTESPAAPGDTTKWMAKFPSLPHELLFTDPMLTQAVAV